MRWAKIIISNDQVRIVWCPQMWDDMGMFQNQGPQKQIVKPTIYQINGHFTLAGWISTQPKTNGSAQTRPSIQIWDELARGLQWSAKTLRGCQPMLDHVSWCLADRDSKSCHQPGCLGGTLQHATLCTTRCLSFLVELVSVFECQET